MKKIELLFIFLFILLTRVSAGSEITGGVDLDYSVLYLDEWSESDLEKNLARGYRSQVVLEVRKQRKRLFPWKKLTSDREEIIKIKKIIHQDVLTGFFTVITDTGIESLNNEFEFLDDAVKDFSHFEINSKDPEDGSFYEFRFILEPVVLKSPLNLITLFMSTQYKSRWNEIPKGFFP